MIEVSYFLATFGGMELIPNHGLGSAIPNYFEGNKTVILTRVKVKSPIEQQNAVHELRVASKKIRTVYRFLERLTEGDFKQKREIAKLRKLFRAGGLLRELQVHQTVLAYYEDLHLCSYRKVELLLAKEIKAARLHYEYDRKRFDPKSLESSGSKIIKILADATEETLWTGLVTFARERFASVLEVLPADYDPEKIHNARILLKEALYLLSILQLAGYRESFDPSLILRVKEATEIAGQWHDREVFCQWLRTQINNATIQTKGPKEYGMLLYDLRMHSKTLAKKFNAMVRSLPIH